MDLQGGWRKLHVLFALSTCRFESSDHCPIFSHVRTSLHHLYMALFWALFQVQVPSSGSETIECGVCQHPFLVSAHWVQINISADEVVYMLVKFKIQLFHGPVYFTIIITAVAFLLLIIGFVALPNFTCILFFSFFLCFNLVCFFRVLLSNLFDPLYKIDAERIYKCIGTYGEFVLVYLLVLLWIYSFWFISLIKWNHNFNRNNYGVK